MALKPVPPERLARTGERPRVAFGDEARGTPFIGHPFKDSVGHLQVLVEASFNDRHAVRSLSTVQPAKPSHNDLLSSTALDLKL